MFDGTRLLNLLGVEEDEIFTTKVTNSTYRVHLGLLQYEDSPESWCTATCATLCQLIGDPSLIIHKPNFTDEEMTFLRLLYKYGKVMKIYKGKGGTSCLTRNGKLMIVNIGESLNLNEGTDLDEMFGAEND